MLGKYKQVFIPVHLAPPPGPWAVTFLVSSGWRCPPLFICFTYSARGKQNKPHKKSHMRDSGMDGLWCMTSAVAIGQGQCGSLALSQRGCPPLFSARCLSLSHLRWLWRIAPFLFRNPLPVGSGRPEDSPGWPVALLAVALPKWPRSSIDSLHSFVIVQGPGPEVWSILPLPGLSLLFPSSLSPGLGRRPPQGWFLG